MAKAEATCAAKRSHALSRSGAGSIADVELSPRARVQNSRGTKAWFWSMPIWPELFEQNGKVSVRVACMSRLGIHGLSQGVRHSKAARWAGHRRTNRQPDAPRRVRRDNRTPSRRISGCDTTSSGRRCRRSRKRIFATTSSTAYCFQPRCPQPVIDAGEGSAKCRVNGGKPLADLRHPDPQHRFHGQQTPRIPPSLLWRA